MMTEQSPGRSPINLPDFKAISARHQAQKMEILGELAARLAHDFNNLLAVISGYGECVVSELEPASNVHADMVQVLKAAERARGLTTALQAFLRDQPSCPQSTDLNQQINELRRMLQMLIGDEIELVFHLDASLPHVKIDSTALHQIIANLVVNGRDAMESGGMVTIETHLALLEVGFFHQRRVREMPGEYFLMKVSDTGCEMDAEALEHLFDRFYTTKSRGKGTGIGLTTVDELVAMAGGYIVVDSKLGLGTSFSIYLPADSEFGIQEAPELHSREGVAGRGEWSQVVQH